MPPQQPPPPKFNFFFFFALALSAWLVFGYFNKKSEPATLNPVDEPVPNAGSAADARADDPAAREWLIRVDAAGAPPEGGPGAALAAPGRAPKGFSAIFSTRGAVLRTYRLRDYFRSPKRRGVEDEVVLLDRPSAAAPGSLMLERLTLSDRIGGEPGARADIDLAHAFYRPTRVPDGALRRKSDGGWTDDWSDADGVEVGGDALEMRAVAVAGEDEFEIIRRFVFPEPGAAGAADHLGFRTEVEIVNRSSRPKYVHCRLWGPAGLLPDDGGYLGRVDMLSAQGGSPGGGDVSVQRRDLGSLAKKPERGETDGRGGLAWVGIKNRFFAALLACEDPAAQAGGAWLAVLGANKDFWTPPAETAAIFANVAAMRLPDGRPAVAAVRLDPERLDGPLAPGESWRHSYRFYGGPADTRLLEAADPRFGNVVAYTFRWFEPISRGLVWFLNHIHRLIGNYGLAIMLLTVIIKTCLHPLAKKMYLNAQAMQRIAPLLQDIKKRYAHDQQKIILESRKLQREHQVNPVGGCLPAFVQLPIFLALYGAFSQHFDIRQARFIPGWIEDLSVPDSVWHFSPLPWVGWSELSLLPILYLAMQVVQMRMQPRSPDPNIAQQQKMMQFMPLLFMFFFYAMPAGLVLYFTASSLYSVVESTLLRRKYPPSPPLTPGAEPVPVDARGRPKAGAGMGMVPAAHSHKKKK